MEVAERSARTPRWSELDDNFHTALYAPAERPRQLAIVMSLRGAVRHYRYAHAALPRSAQEWLRDHRAILDACLRRDVKAARARLATHLERAARQVVGAAETSARVQAPGRSGRKSSEASLNRAP